MRKFTVLFFFTLLSNLVLANEVTVIELHNKSLDQLLYESIENNNETETILEEDAEMSHTLPVPPKESCYMGGWIIPPQITKAGKVKMMV